MSNKNFYWIDSYHEYDTSIGIAVSKDLSEKYAAMAQMSGFSFRLLDAKNLHIGTNENGTFLLHGDENLLTSQFSAYVGTYNPSPAIEHALESIHRVLRDSPNVKLINTTGKLANPDKDKLFGQALASRLGIPTIPTFLLPHNRAWLNALSVIENQLGGYPMIGKPKELLAGFGVTKIVDRLALHAFVENASWSPKSYVIQKYIPLVADCRVYSSKGEVIAFSMRKPTGNGLGNVSQGAKAEMQTIPLNLARWVKLIATELESDYLCADFLFDGNQFHFSEIETGGGFNSLPDSDRLNVARVFFNSGF